MGKYRLRILALFTLSTVFWLNCGKKLAELQPRQSKRATPGGELRLAAQLPSSLDPILSQSYWESGIVLQLFDGLLRLDSSLNIVPGIAQDWSVSRDGRIYRFTLRKGVMFHNGREVVADDFVYSISRLLDPKWKSPDAHAYVRIQGASEFRQGLSSKVRGLYAIDRYHLTIVLDQPYAPFLKLLALQAASVVPREAVEQNPFFARQPVGTGPFILAEWKSKTEIRLKANPDYFQDRPFIDELHIQTFPALSAEQSYQEFAKGKLDVSFVPIDRVTAAKSNRNWVFVRRPVLRLLYLGLNMKAPLVKDPDIREAIYHGINKKELLDSDFDYETTHNIMPFSLLGSRHAEEADPYDPVLASQAISRYCSRNPKPVRLFLWHANLSETRTHLLSKISSGLNALGFEVHVKIVPSMNELLAKIYSGQTQLFLLGEQLDFPDPDALFSRLFNSKSRGNPFGYKSPTVDRLLLDAQMTLEDKQRVDLYREIERLILKDRVIVPLAFVNYSYLHHRRVRNLEVSLLGFQYLSLGPVWIEPE